MKQLLLASVIFMSLSASSQSPSNLKIITIQPVLNEVVQAYFKNFESCKGPVIYETPSVVTYESILKLPGSIMSVINQYSLPDTYSWESLMFETDEFEPASEKYRTLFKELNNSKFSPNGYEKFLLVGNYDIPDEERGFASSLFRLEASGKKWSYFFIDLGMQYQFPEWVIKISIYEKMPDEQMRPGMRSMK